MKVSTLLGALEVTGAWKVWTKFWKNEADRETVEWKCSAIFSEPNGAFNFVYFLPNGIARITKGTVTSVDRDKLATHLREFRDTYC